MCKEGEVIKKQICPFHCKTDVFKVSLFFCPRSINNWNDLPTDIVEAVLPELRFKKVQGYAELFCIILLFRICF